MVERQQSVGPGRTGRREGKAERRVLLTGSSPDVQDIAYDLLGVDQGLGPGHAHLGGRHGHSLYVEGGSRQPLGPQHSQPGAGLGGASTVLGHALVDGLILRADSRNGQGAVGHGGAGKSQTSLA